MNLESDIMISTLPPRFVLSTTTKENTGEISNTLCATVRFHEVEYLEYRESAQDIGQIAPDDHTIIAEKLY